MLLANLAAAPNGMSITKLIHSRWALESSVVELDVKAAMGDAMRAIRKDGWRPFSLSNGLPGAPSAVNALAVRCCAHDPAARPSFRSILECLNGACSEEVNKGWPGSQSGAEEGRDEELGAPKPAKATSLGGSVGASSGGASESPLTGLGVTSMAAAPRSPLRYAGADDEITEHVDKKGNKFFYNSKTFKTGWTRAEVEGDSALVERQEKHKRKGDGGQANENHRFSTEQHAI